MGTSVGRQEQNLGDQFDATLRNPWFMGPNVVDGIKDLIPTFIGVAFFLTFLVVYGGCAAWVIGDAQKRGYSDTALFLLIWLCGPLSALIWLLVRPRTKLVERPAQDYANADDALVAASKLDMLGDWDEAIEL